MPDISLLPEGLRGKEDRSSKPTPAPATESELKMHIPQSTAEEDVEIIEVDESELGAVLAGEPLLTRLTYQLSSALDSLRAKLFAPKEEVAPPKLPPQFFQPPKSGLVTKASTLPPGAALNPPTTPGAPAPAGAVPSPVLASTSAPGATLSATRRPSHARITPQAEVPKRVRVIKRVRKSVRVSLIPEEQLLAYQIDVPKRIWTLAVISVLFLVIIGGGYFFLSDRVRQTRVTLSDLNSQVNDTRATSRTRQQEWSTYADLQQRLTLLDDLLKGHVVISRMFDFLEARTLPQVAYRTASLQPNGVLTLDVQADSFQSSARQLVSFEESPLVKKVDATAFNAEVDATGTVRNVSFQLILNLDPAPLRGLLLAGDSAAVQAAIVPTSTQSTTP